MNARGSIVLVAVGVLLSGCARRGLVQPAIERHVIELRNTSDRHLEVSVTSQTPRRMERKAMEVAPRQTVSTNFYTTSRGHMPAITFREKGASSLVGPIYLGEGSRTLQQAADDPHRFDIVEYRGALLLVPRGRDDPAEAAAR